MAVAVHRGWAGDGRRRSLRNVVELPFGDDMLTEDHVRTARSFLAALDRASV